MSKYDELVGRFADLFQNRVELKIRVGHGLLGNGLGQVQVPGRPNYSYYRPDKTSNYYTEIFNMIIIGQDGDPIIYGEYPWQPELTQVFGFDYQAYPQEVGGWGTVVGNTPTHGATHQWQDNNLGIDTFHVFRRQLGDLKVVPVSEDEGTTVRVTPYSFYLGGTRYAWDNETTFDVSAAIPAGTGTAAWGLVYWDVMPNTIGLVTGSIRPSSSLLEGDRPMPPLGTIPSGFIKLEAGMTNVTSFDMYGGREILHPLLYFGSGSFGINALNIPFYDDSGYYTGTSTVNGALERLGPVNTYIRPFRIAGAAGTSGSASQPTIADSVGVNDYIHHPGKFLSGGVVGESLSSHFAIITRFSTSYNNAAPGGQDIALQIRNVSNFTAGNSSQAGILFSNLHGSVLSAAYIGGVSDIPTGTNTHIVFAPNRGDGTRPEAVMIRDSGRVAVGTPTGTAKAQVDIDQNSAITDIPVLRLHQTYPSGTVFQFDGTIGTGNTIDTGALGTYYGKIRVMVEGVGIKTLPLYNDD